MKRRSFARTTKQEERLIREIERESAFTLLDNGRARVLSPREYPAPLRRFLRREKLMLHIKLTPSLKRKLELRSRRTGVLVDQLARRCIEAGLKRDAG